MLKYNQRVRFEKELRMKKQFEVKENETISECLDRMQKEGFKPIRRVEKPIFQEVIKGNKKDYIPVSQQIIFYGEKTE